MRADIIKEPIVLGNGEVCHMFKDDKGDYYCPVCGELTGLPAFQIDEDGFVSVAHELICSDCFYQPGFDLHLDKDYSLKDWEDQIRSCRITWLCRSGWPVKGIGHLVENLGVSFSEIQEYERLAGRDLGIDARFRRDHDLPRKLKYLQEHRHLLPEGESRFSERSPLMKTTCPCCGKREAIEAMFQTCWNCGWIYAPVQEINPDDRSEPNRVSLRDAQVNYQKYGAKRAIWAGNLQPPPVDPGTDPQWRPLQNRR